MGKCPLISIIVPVYNVEKYLRQCVDSIVAQTFPDWELLLVDDGSKDSSGAICDEYAAADSRIRVIHKENGGQSDSRNVALREARADLIGYVDSDDWIEPDMYAVLYRTMKDTGADISICGYFTSMVDNERPSCNGGNIHVYDRDEALLHLLRDRQIKNYLWDKLYKRKVITADLPKSVSYEDYATLVKWFASSETVALCDKPEYHYRQRRSSIDHDYNYERKWQFYLAEKERCAFIRESGLLPEIGDELDARVVRAGISQAKDISRSRNNDEAIRYIERIYDDLNATYDLGTVSVGLKSWWRLCLLRFSRKCFMNAMRFSHMFVFGNLSKKRRLYE